MPNHINKNIRALDLANLLDNNGYASAAADIRHGVDPAAATRYLFGQEPHYIDAEGYALMAYISSLHSGRDPARPHSEQELST